MSVSKDCHGRGCVSQVDPKITPLEEIAPLEVGEGVSSLRELSQAFSLLEERWLSGARDRETALRLAYLGWINCADLPFDICLEKRVSFGEIFSHLGGVQGADAEVLYAFGTMASLFPYCCGEVETWEAIGDELLERISQRGGPPNPEVFRGRGAYGKYFEHMAGQHCRRQDA